MPWTWEWELNVLWTTMIQSFLSAILISEKSISLFFSLPFWYVHNVYTCSIFFISPPFSLVNWKQILWGSWHFKTMLCFWYEWGGFHSQWNLSILQTLPCNHKMRNIYTKEDRYFWNDGKKIKWLQGSMDYIFAEVK